MSRVKTARYNAKKRLGAAKITSITIDDVLEMWKKQNCKCYYSKIPMTVRPMSDWQCSLERLDTTLGYIKDNVVLCCLEFNHSSQWTPDKVSELFRIRENENYIDVDFEQEVKSKTWSKMNIETIDGVIHKECIKCHIMKPKTLYYKGTTCCKVCTETHRKDALNNPHPFIMRLLNSIRSSTSIRSKTKIKQKRDLTRDIDFDFIVSLYKQQKGRCFYSGVPLAFGSYKEKNWVMSVERIDPMKGYVKNNVCLIAYEFNTRDGTSLSESGRVQGSSAWNKEKFEYFAKTYKKCA
jgi:hypothetical protein